MVTVQGEQGSPHGLGEVPGRERAGRGGGATQTQSQVSHYPDRGEPSPRVSCGISRGIPSLSPCSAHKSKTHIFYVNVTALVVNVTCRSCLCGEGMAWDQSLHNLSCEVTCALSYCIPAVILSSLQLWQPVSGCCDVPHSPSHNLPLRQGHLTAWEIEKEENCGLYKYDICCTETSQDLIEQPVTLYMFAYFKLLKSGHFTNQLYAKRCAVGIEDVFTLISLLKWFVCLQDFLLKLFLIFSAKSLPTHFACVLKQRNALLRQMLVPFL